MANKFPQAISVFVAERVKAEALAAMQEAEELHGPGSTEAYVRLMREIAAHASMRADACATNNATTVVEYFELHGWTYEYPGFLNYNLGGGKCITMGCEDYSNLEKAPLDKALCISVMTDEGDHVDGEDFTCRGCTEAAHFAAGIIARLEVRS